MFNSQLRLGVYYRVSIKRYYLLQRHIISTQSHVCLEGELLLIHPRAVSEIAGKHVLVPGIETCVAVFLYGVNTQNQIVTAAAHFDTPQGVEDAAQRMLSHLLDNGVSATAIQATLVGGNGKLYGPLSSDVIYEPVCEILQRAHVPSIQHDHWSIIPCWEHMYTAKLDLASGAVTVTQDREASSQAVTALLAFSSTHRSRFQRRQARMELEPRPPSHDERLAYHQVMTAL